MPASWSKALQLYPTYSTFSPNNEIHHNNAARKTSFILILHLQAVSRLHRCALANSLVTSVVLVSVGWREPVSKGWRRSCGPGFHCAAVRVVTKARQRKWQCRQGRWRRIKPDIKRGPRPIWVTIVAQLNRAIVRWHATHARGILETSITRRHMMTLCVPIGHGEGMPLSVAVSIRR